MGGTAPSVRDMRPDDVPAVAALHADAFRGALGPALGMPYLRSFLNWFLGQPQAVRLVTECEGVPAGYVVGAPLADLARVSRDLMPTIVLALVTHPRALFHRNFARQLPVRLAGLLGGWRASRSPRSAGPAVPQGGEAVPESLFGLVGIGVGSRFRGRGMGDALMAGFETRVVALGFSRIALEVYEDNTAARRLYDRHGYAASRVTGPVLRYERPCGPPS